MRVVVVGAGLVGCASALALARRGAEVVVLERGAFGELAASRAAAGILGAQLERHASAAMLELCVASRDRYPSWIAEIEAASGMSVDFRRCGAMRVAFADAERDEIAAEVEQQKTAGHEAELLDRVAARRLEPALSDAVCAAAWFPRDGVLDPPKLLEALRVSARRVGVVFRCGVTVSGLEQRAERVVGARIEDERGEGAFVPADQVVVAAGSWSSLIADLQRMGIAADLVLPARGQMVELVTVTSPIERVVDAPGAYLSPRSDGRVLVGSTVELVGHQRAVTAAGAKALLDGALAAVPSLAEARLAGHWCGFRALTPDQLPILSRGPREGLLLASGHFRNGVVLAPLTAEVVADLATGVEPSVDLAPFTIERFTRGAVHGGSASGSASRAPDPSP